MELIDGNWNASLLPQDLLAALKFTDYFILTPGPVPDEIRSSLLSTLTPLSSRDTLLYSIYYLLYSISVSYTHLTLPTILLV